MHDGNNVRAESVPAARKYVNSTYEYSRAESISHVSVTNYLEPNVLFNMDPNGPYVRKSFVGGIS